MKAKCFVILLFLVACKQSGKVTSESQWIQLFNGQDLTGWSVKIAGYALDDNYKNTFRVEDGVIKASYDEYDNFTNQFGHLFYKDKFSHYRLRVEYRFVGEQVPGGQDWAYRNSGVMFHCQSPESMLVEQHFPVCIEAQFLGGSGEGERPTANLCTPGTHVYIADTLVEEHCINSTSKTYHNDVWVTFEMYVKGDEVIHHILDGDTVLTYSKPHIGGDLPDGFPLPEGTPVKEGYIALQSESHPIEFRKVELLDLSEE